MENKIIIFYLNTVNVIMSLFNIYYFLLAQCRLHPALFASRRSIAASIYMPTNLLILHRPTSSADISAYATLLGGGTTRREFIIYYYYL